VRVLFAVLALSAALAPVAVSAVGARISRPTVIAWAPGSSIAVSTTTGVFSAASGRPARLLTTRGSGFTSLDWAPNGQTLLFGSASNLDVIQGDGAKLRSLGAGVAGRWSPDGRRIAFYRPDGLFVMNANGTGAHQLARDRYATSAPTWSPDGKRIAFVACSAAFLSRPCEHQYGFDLYSVLAAGGGKRRLTPKSGYPQCPAWSKAGYLAYTTADNQLALLQADGHVRTFTLGGCPAWAPGGHRLAVFGRDGPILLNADGSGRRALHVLPKPTFSSGPNTDRLRDRGRWRQGEAVHRRRRRARARAPDLARASFSWRRRPSSTAGPLWPGAAVRQPLKRSMIPRREARALQRPSSRLRAVRACVEHRAIPLGRHSRLARL
jgi:dipeptidyl aminopeptidase/acylaminoacyl peptidase